MTGSDCFEIKEDSWFTKKKNNELFKLIKVLEQVKTKSLKLLKFTDDNKLK